MKITQGAFSFLPDLSDDQIRKQVQYCIDNGWAVSIEHTDDPHPRNVYWDMWGHPMFDNPDAAALLLELNACRKQFGNRYVRVVAFDSTKGWESLRLSFIVNRPANEPGFRLTCQDMGGRQQAYTITSYAVDKPPGERYLD